MILVILNSLYPSIISARIKCYTQNFSMQLIIQIPKYFAHVFVLKHLLDFWVFVQYVKGEKKKNKWKRGLKEQRKM